MKVRLLSDVPKLLRCGLKRRKIHTGSTGGRRGNLLIASLYVPKGSRVAMLIKRAHSVGDHVVVQGLGCNDKEAHSCVGNLGRAQGVVRNKFEDGIVRFSERSLDGSLKAGVVVAHGVCGV